MFQNAIQSSGSIRAFAYATTEKAALYRAIMRVFMESKARFEFHLRPKEILDQIRICGFQESRDQTEIESALAQLCEWGNLEAHPDTTDVSTVEDFYKQRYAFQITKQGEAAQRALELFQTTSERKSELPAGALADIRALLQELNQLSKEAELDSSKTHRNLLTLRARFEDLADSAQEFMGTLQRKIDLRVAEAGESISEKQRLIDYLQRFIGEFVIATGDIAHAVRDIEAVGLEKLLKAAAERSVVDAMETNPEDLDRALNEWRSTWNRFRDWFISRPDCLSNSDLLRGHARASMRALLSSITSINDQLITRIDRSNDLRVLARWFIEARSEADAHRLWRAVFGLCPARHLIINDATLDEHETRDVLPDTSWLDAPPLNISPRFRASSAYWRTGRLSRIIDRGAEKEKLAAATYEEALHILRAQNRFATGARMRLSELAQLKNDEFDLLLEFLGETVTVKGFPPDTAEILSSDGSLRVTLEPTDDGETAAIQTPEGIFSGPDHWIIVERNSTEEAVT